MNIETILKEFDLSEPMQSKEELAHLTLGIPKSYKMRFDKQQARTNKKFGKALRKVFMHMIDLVDVDEAS